MTNALTIDVEDYWSIFSRDWLHKDTEPTEMVVKNTEWFLETLAGHNVKATFFVLGEVAKKFPSLIKKITEDGHEIGAHGFSHKQIFKLSKEQFRQEVAESKKLLEDITGKAIMGYRAPAFSIMPQTKWALEILAQEGFKYDSSIYPISGKRYGWPGFSKDICKLDLPSGRRIVEVPMSTVRIFGRDLPAAGGGYIRHFPYAITKWAIKRIQKTRPTVVYMHPYEFSSDRPRVANSSLFVRKRFRSAMFSTLQYRNRWTMKSKLRKLLADFEFSKIIDVYGSIIDNLK